MMVSLSQNVVQLSYPCQFTTCSLGRLSPQLPMVPVLPANVVVVRNAFGHSDLDSVGFTNRCFRNLAHMRRPLMTLRLVPFWLSHPVGEQLPDPIEVWAPKCCRAASRTLTRSVTISEPFSSSVGMMYLLDV